MIGMRFSCSNNWCRCIFLWHSVVGKVVSAIPAFDHKCYKNTLCLASIGRDCWIRFPEAWKFTDQFCLYSPIQWGPSLSKWFLIPYRKLNYRGQKFAMVLSSFDIHRLKVSLITWVFIANNSGVTVAHQWKCVGLHIWIVCETLSSKFIMFRVIVS